MSATSAQEVFDHCMRIFETHRGRGGTKIYLGSFCVLSNSGEARCIRPICMFLPSYCTTRYPEAIIRLTVVVCFFCA